MTRTILIGLDGATFDVLKPLWEDGTMPFLRSFVVRGVHAVLESVIPALTPSAWTSLITGQSPGTHGIFDFARITRNEKYLQYQMATSTDIQSETLWSIASRQGRKVATLNFPVMIPPQPIAGYSISGFAPWRHLRKAVYPPELYDTLTSIPGFSPKELAFDIEQERKAIQVLDQKQYEDWIIFHIRREERWLEVVRYLLNHARCDILAVLFDGVDKLQHICWRFIDPALSSSDAAPWERKARELCLAYFRRLDEILDELVNLAGPDTRIFIASDHGFGPTNEIFYVNTWLSQHGYLSWAPDVPCDSEDKVMLDGTRSPGALFDWTKTKVCSLSSGSNGIYIRTANGSSQQGVRPGEYEAFRQQLRLELLDFRDPNTGDPVVRRALTREEAFKGPQMEHAPDLTLELRDGGFVSILRSRQPLKQREMVAGTHRPNGVFLGAGPGIRQNTSVPPFSIIDVATILLYSLGLPIPSDFEGRLPGGIYDEDLLSTTPVQFGNATVPPKWAVTDESVLFDDQITARMKVLGYLE